MQTYNIIESIDNHQYAVRILKNELLSRCYKFLCSLSDSGGIKYPRRDQYDENRILFDPIKIELNIGEGDKTYTTAVEAISFLRVDENLVEFKFHKDRNKTGHLSVTLVSDKHASPWDQGYSEDYWRIWRTAIDIETGRGQHIEYDFKQPEFLTDYHEC